MKPKKSPPRHAVDISEEAGVRYLHFGSDWVQGAMRIARPWSLELAYTREMMAGLLLRGGEHWPRNALLVGLGAGSLAKFIYRNLPDCRITVVEINPQVEFIARQYFKLPDDPARLSVVTGDGAEFMLAGERRFRASQRAGKPSIPAVVVECSDEEAFAAWRRGGGGRGQRRAEAIGCHDDAQGHDRPV